VHLLDQAKNPSKKEQFARTFAPTNDPILDQPCVQSTTSFNCGTAGSPKIATLYNKLELFLLFSGSGTKPGASLAALRTSKGRGRIV
jgi:hypothetical protein